MHCFTLLQTGWEVSQSSAVYGYNIFWSKSTKSDKLYGFYCNITQKLYLCEEFKFEKILCHCLPPHHSRLQSTPPTANQHLTMLPIKVINITMNSYHIHDGSQSTSLPISLVIGHWDLPSRLFKTRPAFHGSHMGVNLSKKNNGKDVKEPLSSF